MSKIISYFRPHADQTITEQSVEKGWILLKQITKKHANNKKIARTHTAHTLKQSRVVWSIYHATKHIKNTSKSVTPLPRHLLSPVLCIQTEEIRTVDGRDGRDGRACGVGKHLKAKSNRSDEWSQSEAINKNRVGTEMLNRSVVIVSNNTLNRSVSTDIDTHIRSEPPVHCGRSDKNRHFTNTYPLPFSRVPSRFHRTQLTATAHSHRPATATEQTQKAEEREREQKQSN